MNILKGTTADVLLVWPAVRPNAEGIALEIGSEVSAVLIPGRTERHVSAYHVNAEVRGVIYAGYCGARSLKDLTLLGAVNEGSGSPI